jgi:hypothetical protein
MLTTTALWLAYVLGFATVWALIHMEDGAC